MVLVNFDIDGDLYKAVLVLNSIFLPLQGCFNLLTSTAAEWRPCVDKQVARLSSRCRNLNRNNDTADNITPPVGPGTIHPKTSERSQWSTKSFENVSVESKV